MHEEEISAFPPRSSLVESRRIAEDAFRGLVWSTRLITNARRVARICETPQGGLKTPHLRVRVGYLSAQAALMNSSSSPKS